MTDGPCATFLKNISASRFLPLLKKLLAMGEGWTTTMSMPCARTSPARETANIVMKALVAEYSAESGLGRRLAEEEVKAIRPLLFLATSAARKWCVIGRMAVELQW